MFKFNFSLHKRSFNFNPLNGCKLAKHVRHEITGNIKRNLFN